MITISEVNIDQIASKKANWYLILLEDNLTDPLRRELYDNVDFLADAVCPNNWVVRGHKNKKDEFFSAIFHRYRLYLSDYSFENFPRPTILVTNTVPPAEGITNADFEKIIRIVFPLTQKYVRPGSISDFLNNLSRTVRRPDALESLVAFNEKKFIETWGWILDCFELKPSFLGVFSFDVKEFFKQALKK
jgi:hypothetical protein